MDKSLLFTAWKKLLIAYGISLGCCLVVGSGLIHLLGVAPESVFTWSTKRLSYAIPVLDAGSQAGIDNGALIFFWNSLAALVTISFIYTAALLNPHDLARPPKGLRKLLCGKSRMRLLCFLPGCSQIKAEPLRRLYVWLMIPLLSLVLLGIESGLSLSTSKYVFGSYLAGILSLLPHGIVEIPAFALAGALPYSAHLVVKQIAPFRATNTVFQELHEYRKPLPVKKTALLVILSLLFAGLIEAHITDAFIEWATTG